MLTEVTNAVRGRQTVNPKTILGYYAIVLGLVLTGSVSAIGTLAATDTATSAIPFILVFAALVLVLLIVGPLIIAWKDPSKLMLTQVTGSEYVEIQHRRVLGDSDQGDRIVTESGAPTAIVISATATTSGTASSATEVESAGPA